MNEKNVIKIRLLKSTLSTFIAILITQVKCNFQGEPLTQVHNINKLKLNLIV